MRKNSNWDKKPDIPPAPISSQQPEPQIISPLSSGSTIVDALARDKERLRKAALKNLEYMRKKEIREIEQRLAQTADAELSAKTAGSGGQRSAKRARISRAGIGSGSIKNSSVYISNLPSTVESSLLEKLFSTCGRVRKVKIYRDATGGAKGDALVTYVKPPSAAEATRQLNGKTYPEGSAMSVGMAEFEQKNEGIETENDGWTGQYGQGAGLGYSIVEQNEDAAGSVLDELKSNSVLLRNVFCPDLAKTAAGYMETIQADIEVECARLGKLRKIESLSDGSFLLQFDNEQIAERCIDLMHGRWFDERQIIADYWSSVQTNNQDSGNNVKPKRAPCRSVILRDVFTDEQAASNPDFLKNLENDFGFECSKAGPIAHLECIKGGSICITYESTISAASCIEVMNGRFFDERQIAAEYDYSKQDAEAPKPEKLMDVAVEQDDDAKLQRFLAFVSSE